MRPLHEIIVHCSATQPNWAHDKSAEWKVQEIRRWHMSTPRNWSDIGYHYIIDRDGTIAKGRPLERIGAHVQGHNTGTIGICLIGGHGSTATDDPTDHFTINQLDAARRFIDDLRAKYPTIRRVSGHNDYTDGKACPGFKVAAWMAMQPIVDWVDEPKPSAPSFWAGIIDAIKGLFQK